jgi:2-keto-4-pentenoate hydratase/2-oxohepta-3-ene-1,7-dioic acid hydratase in catechol pathway
MRRYLVKLVMYDGEQLGVLTQNDTMVVNVMDAVRHLPSYPYGQLAKEVIEHWDEVKGEVELSATRGQGTPLQNLKFLPPVPKPDKILCVGINYWEPPHRMELSMMDAFQKNSECPSGNGDVVLLPPFHDLALQANMFHPEPELAFVISKTARFVTQNEAMDYVFGYMNSCDLSLRRKNPPQYGNMFTAKSCQGFYPCGPALVTKDEVRNPYDLRVRLIVNETETGYSSRDMQHHIPEVVEFLSKVTTLRPGDCISLGNHHAGLQSVMDGDNVTICWEQMGPPLSFSVSDPLHRDFPRTAGL